MNGRFSIPTSDRLDERASARTPRRPYGSYAAITGSFLGSIAFLAAASRRRPLREYNAVDAGLLALATFKAARTLARDDVTSFLRKPFVEETASPVDDGRPVPSGDMRQAVGELVTCTRCVGTWAAAGITAAEVLSPPFGRMLVRTLALGGANDWLQAGFAALTGRADPRSPDVWADAERSPAK